MYIFYKAGGSENKFRESRIRKFANLNNLLDLQMIRKCDKSRIFAICGANLFVICGLKTSVSPQIHIFLLTNIA